MHRITVDCGTGEVTTTDLTERDHEHRARNAAEVDRLAQEAQDETDHRDMVVSKLAQAAGVTPKDILRALRLALAEGD
jgi:hypothetical protein